MNRRVMLSGLSVAIIVVGLLWALTLRSSREHNLTIGGIGSAGTSALIYSYGQEKGIFQKHGLNVTYIPFRDLYTMMLSFFSGSVDTVGTSPGVAANSYNEGEKFKIAIALCRSSEHMLLVQPGIEKLSDLRGKRLGVHGRTSDNYNIIKWYLESKGMDIEADLDLIEIRSPANLVTSFKTGQLDAVVLWGRFAVEVKNWGGIPLVLLPDAVQELIGYPHYIPLVLFRNDFIEENRPTVRSYLRAQREISREIKANKDEAARILAEFSGEPVETSTEVIGLIDLIADLDDEIQQGILAFFEYGAENGYFDEAPDKGIFYDEWK